MNSSDLWIESFFVGSLAMRCSVVTDLSSGDTVIIDGGSESDRLIAWINNFEGLGPDWSNGPNNLEEMEHYGITSRNVVALVNTHAHFDHSGEIPLLLEEYNVSWYLHNDDFFLQSLAQSSAMRWGFNLPEPAIADKLLHDGMDLQLGGLRFKILHTPGHTLGGCCILIEVDDGPDQLFAGDTLFAGYREHNSTLR
jgi:hydroxyacylglutathione hydrolase